MKPYYDEDGVQIYLGDCREVLGQIRCAPQVVLADPPYGETSLAWDQWPTGWVAEVGSTTARWTPLWCFGSLRMFLAHADEFAAWKLAQDVVWEKHNGTNFQADRFNRVHELAVQWYRGEWAAVWKEPVTTADAVAKQVRKKGRPAHTGDIDASAYTSEDGGPRLARSVQRVRSCHGYAVHPTQKPLGILEPLVRYSAPPGSLVLDPFLGSGSTAEVARQLGYRCVGIEIDERYCEIAAKRLAQGVLPLGVG